MGTAQLTGGNIFDIQGFSVHDGPGCRTLIFFKGCTMNCDWCSNPEGIRPCPEPLYDPSKCTMDLLCKDACQDDAISVEDGVLLINRETCGTCTTSACMDSCCTGAICKAGYFINTAELFRKIQRDRKYWGPDGGVTLTGGEPFLQAAFAKTVLKKCYESFIHTSVETCGNVPWDSIGASLEWIDWVFYDLKQMDPELHKKATGTDNKRILKNARQLTEKFTGRLIFRIPLIPGFNDDERSLGSFAEFIGSTGRKEVNILPVHHMAREKYRLLNKPYYTTEFTNPSAENLHKASTFLTGEGLTCYVGSDTPF